MSRATIGVFMAKATTTCAERWQMALTATGASSLSATVVDAHETKKKRRRFEECGTSPTPGEHVAEAQTALCTVTPLCVNHIFLDLPFKINVFFISTLSLSFARFINVDTNVSDEHIREVEANIVLLVGIRASAELHRLSLWNHEELRVSEGAGKSLQRVVTAPQALMFGLSLTGVCIY